MYNYDKGDQTTTAASEGLISKSSSIPSPLRSTDNLHDDTRLLYHQHPCNKGDYYQSAYNTNDRAAANNPFCAAANQFPYNRSNQSWSRGFHHPQQQARRVVTPMPPDDELRSMLESYLEPKRQGSLSEGGGYSYSIPPGAILNSSSSGYNNSGFVNSGFSSGFQQSPSNQSVDSGFGDGGSSGMSPYSSHHQQSFSSQHSFAYNNSASSSHHIPVGCEVVFPNGNSNSSNAHHSFYAGGGQYSEYESSQSYYSASQHASPSGTPLLYQDSSNSNSNSSRTSNHDSSSSGMASTDQDISVIVDQVLDSIDAQFSSSNSSSPCGGGEGSEGGIGSAVWPEENGTRVEDAHETSRLNDDEVGDEEEKASAGGFDKKKKTNVLCHQCANLVEVGAESCDACGMVIGGEDTMERTDDPGTFTKPFSTISRAVAVAVARPLQRIPNHESNPKSSSTEITTTSNRSGSSIGVVKPRVVLKIRVKGQQEKDTESCEDENKSQKVSLTDENEDEDKKCHRHRKKHRKHKKHKKRHHHHHHHVCSKKRRSDSVSTPDIFHITETLPEHFKLALQAKTKGSIGSSSSSLSLLKDVEEASSSLADQQRKGRKRKSSSSATGSEEDRKEVLNEGVDEGGRRESQRKRKKDSHEAAEGNNGLLNPLKLIRRFVPGTNQEEYKIEKARQKDSCLVDLEEDEEKLLRDSYPIRGDEMQAFLRKKMPLLHISLVGTDGSKTDKGIEGKKKKIIPLVRLERMTEKDIAKHTGNKKVAEQLLPFSLRQKDMKNFRELAATQQEVDLDTKEEKRTHINQTCERARRASSRRKVLQPSSSSFLAYRGGRIDLEEEEEKEEKKKKRVICKQSQKEVEKGEGRKGGKGNLTTPTCSSRKEGEKDEEEEKGLSTALLGMKLNDDNNSFDDLMNSNDENDAIADETKEEIPDSSSDSFYDLTDFCNDDQEDHSSPDDEAKEDQEEQENDFSTSGKDPFMTSSRDDCENLMMDDALDGLMSHQTTSLTSSSAVSNLSENSNSSSSGSSNHSNLSMPILFSDDGNVQDFSSLLSFQSFEMSALTANEMIMRTTDNVPNNSSSNASLTFEAAGRVNENLNGEGRKAAEATTTVASADNGPDNAASAVSSSTHFSQDISSPSSQNDISPNGVACSNKSDIPPIIGGDTPPSENDNSPLQRPSIESSDEDEVKCLTPLLPPTPPAEKDDDDKQLSKKKKRRLGRPPKKPKETEMSKPAVTYKKVVITTATEQEADDKWLYCPRPDCDFSTRKSDRMSRHRKSHVAGTSRFRCPDCPEVFGSLARMLKHDRIKHTGEKEYECKICATEVSDIQVHMRVHKSEKQFRCDVCTLEFRHKNSLVRHLVQHSAQKPFRCQLCPNAFANMNRLKEHCKRKHQLAPPPPAPRGPLHHQQHLLAMRQYHPIAPAPLKGRPPHFAPILPQPSTAISAPHQPISYLAPGPNGTMYLITNPQPPQNQSFLLFNNGNPFMSTSNQPIFIQPPQQQNLLYGGGDPFTPSPSVMSSLLSPREAALLTAPTPEAAMPEPSREPLLDLPKMIQEEEETRQLEIRNSDGSVTFANSDMITFEMSSGELSSSAEEEGAITLRTENGGRIRYDILERAILEIPDLDEMVPDFVQEQQQQEEDKKRPSTSSSKGNEASRDEISVSKGADSIGASVKSDQRRRFPGKSGGETGETSANKRNKNVLEKDLSVVVKVEEEEEVNEVLDKKEVAKTSGEVGEEVSFDCEKCGRKYKFENFLKVHQRRPC